MFCDYFRAAAVIGLETEAIRIRTKGESGPIRTSSVLRRADIFQKPRETDFPPQKRNLIMSAVVRFTLSRALGSTFASSSRSRLWFGFGTEGLRHGEQVAFAPSGESCRRGGFGRSRLSASDASAQLGKHRDLSVGIMNAGAGPNPVSDKVIGGYFPVSH